MAKQQYLLVDSATMQTTYASAVDFADMAYIIHHELEAPRSWIVQAEGSGLSLNAYAFVNYANDGETEEQVFTKFQGFSPAPTVLRGPKFSMVY